MKNPLIEQAFTQINQNSAVIQKRYYSRTFTVEILRNWYLERLFSEPPIVNGSEVYYKQLRNFTQIGWASTSRFGCAIGLVKKKYRIICNYYPFESLEKAAYMLGEPCSHCPRDTPLCSHYFQYLCTVGNSAATPGQLIRIMMPIILVKLLTM